MEFLMTYGLAIAIVLAVVVALYATGVFKLPTGGVGKCSPCFPPASAVLYVDHDKDKLVIKVGPKEIQNVRAYVGTTVTSVQEGPFSPGTLVTIEQTGLFANDTVEVTIEYQDVVSGLYHNVTATLRGA